MTTKFTGKVIRYIFPKHGVIRNATAAILKKWRFLKNMRFLGPLLRLTGKGLGLVVKALSKVLSKQAISKLGRLVVALIPKFIAKLTASAATSVIPILNIAVSVISAIWFVYDIIDIASIIWPDNAIL
jgi:hypothetical protein